ncbi:MAG: pyridoxal-phosphate dependent enzyme [Kiritimatiellia bacterium]|jgi:cysteine synthase|nr:pyridoxal-phosphate dependent enzyme [Kiritimatiellia bacterium]MDP6631763.1 pyridoxal-phosphate dependent enzyme [Kiritimatiellia bacterium]MDP6810483.1 pyridoxal-phosphate dependent enzyme [Kiritimatiellia bacterium]MDP7024999.1 pyridoxal-phosphate dependent enzyme [Kiritimatiellia bacterium]
MQSSGRLNEEVRTRAVARARERGVVLPTFAQQRDPALIPPEIKARLAKLGLWDIDPLNLFRITWKNEPQPKGGGFGDGNWLEFPSALTGVDARIVGVVGKWLPTGSHKVGAAYGCLVPRLVTGQFDPTAQKAVWPSTGNYCRGGAYDCALLGCPAVAILPEEMSRERFEWLREIGTDEIIATPGSESNVKEIYDKCHELRATRGDDIVIFNQFEEFGNAIWHYHVTGLNIEDIYENAIRSDDSRLAAYVSATGSAGTIAAGDYLRTKSPDLRVVAVEALQCPTLYQFGFGAHRIEGIGDKHVPWIHNVRNTDAVCAVDDEQVMQLLRLFNEEEGKATLAAQGVDASVIESLDLLGISSICNLVAAIHTARLYGFEDRDVIFVPLTDSMELYVSRKVEMAEAHGPYTKELAGRHIDEYLAGTRPDHMRELSDFDRRCLHNFKYFTWVEQQGRGVEELRELWDGDFWKGVFDQGRVDEWDRSIEEFNSETGVLKGLVS